MAEGSVVFTKKTGSGTVIWKRAGYSLVSVETTDLHLGHTNVAKYVDIVRCEISDVRGTVNPSIEVGYRDSLSDPVVYVPAQSIGEGQDSAFYRLNAKFYRIRVSLSTNQGYFVWAGLEFYGAPDGLRHT